MLSIEHKNLVCLITIDRPPVNALNVPLLEQLIEAISLSGSHADHAIILSGVPGRFSAGLDTKELAAATAEERTKIMSLLGRLLAVTANCPVPIASAITGHCLGGAAVLAALCDYRVMGRGDYKIGLPEVTLGVQLTKTVHSILARLVGAHLAQRLCMEGILLDPGQAYGANLVDDVVEPDAVTGAASDWCEQILSLPQETMLTIRREVRADIRALYAARVLEQQS